MMFKVSKTFFYKGLSFVLLCCLFGGVIYFRQQRQPTVLAAPHRAAPETSVGTPRSLVPVGDTAARPREGAAAPSAAIPPPSHTSTFADSIDHDFYQTIIRNNIFAPLGTVFSDAPEPGRHLTLVGTFLAEDPEASSVLVKNTTTGRHHLLSVGEGVGDFHVLAVEPKTVRLYHHGTEVSLHLPENVLLNAKRR